MYPALACRPCTLPLHIALAHCLLLLCIRSRAVPRARHALAGACHGCSEMCVRCRTQLAGAGMPVLRSGPRHGSSLACCARLSALSPRWTTTASAALLLILAQGVAVVAAVGAPSASAPESVRQAWCAYNYKRTSKCAAGACMVQEDRASSEHWARDKTVVESGSGLSAAARAYELGRK